MHNEIKKFYKINYIIAIEKNIGLYKYKIIDFYLLELIIKLYYKIQLKI